MKTRHIQQKLSFASYDILRQTAAIAQYPQEKPSYSYLFIDFCGMTKNSIALQFLLLTKY